MNLTYKALTSDQETEVQRVPNAKQTATVFGGQPENKQPIPVGPIGPQGPKGDKGDTGATGPQGLKGDPGPQGDQGSSGPVGPAGPIGGPGPKGDKGDTGATGPQGPVGAQGSTGPQGPIGLTGPQGPKGDKGDKGDIGNTGPTGPPGPVPEAPLDGTVYGRKNATWSPVAATGNATTVDDTPPASPKYGDRWIKPSNGSEMVWVPNAGTPGVWLNPVDAAMANAITYPIAINKGGTGATDAPTALVNLGGTAVGTGVFTAATAAAARAVLGAEPTIAGGTTAQYWRGDKAWATLDKVAVGLGNVDNTSDVGKPVSTAQAAADALRVLKAGDSMTGALLLSAGTVAAPGLAFNSEPGLGWYRNGASVIRLAAQGAAAFELDSSNAAATFASFFPRSATGAAELDLYSRPATSAGAQSWLGLKVAVSGEATISTGAAGGPTRGNLTLDAPAVTINAVPAGNATIILCDSAGAQIKQIRARSNNSNLEFVNAANSAIITTMTDAGAWTSSGGFSPTSDERIKHDIEALAPIDFAAIQPISFKRNADPESGTHYGFSAQNLHRVAQPLVVGDFDTDKPAAIDPVGILALTVLEVQTLINAVKTLNQRISQLELQ